MMILYQFTNIVMFYWYNTLPRPVLVKRQSLILKVKIFVGTFIAYVIFYCYLMHILTGEIRPYPSRQWIKEAIYMRRSDTPSLLLLPLIPLLQQLTSGYDLFRRVSIRPTFFLVVVNNATQPISASWSSCVAGSRRIKKVKVIALSQDKFGDKFWLIALTAWQYIFLCEEDPPGEWTKEFKDRSSNMPLLRVPMNCVPFWTRFNI